MHKETGSNPLLAKSKYVFPNVITALSLVMGLLSCFYSIQGQYVTASWVILFSVVLDKLDGSTARALKASSPFGVQFDSFSDFVAFGIAPVVLVFSIATNDEMVKAVFEAKETPLFLYFSLIFFVLASAMRLARFNITTTTNQRFMVGLPTTASGGLIACCVLTCYAHYDIYIFVKLLQWLPYLLLLLGGLEVSNLPMIKIGHRESKWARNLELLLSITVLLCIISRSLPEFLLISSSTYITVGFIDAFKERHEIIGGLKAVGTDGSGGSETKNEDEISDDPKAAL